MDFDVSELLAYADDLDTAAAAILSSVQPAVKQSAEQVKAGMRADMEASRHFRPVARSITYDLRTVTNAVEAQIGPITRGATVGDLAHLAYFGGAHGGGGTVRDPQDALDDHARGFELALADVIEGLL